MPTRLAVNVSERDAGGSVKGTSLRPPTVKYQTLAVTSTVSACVSMEDIPEGVLLGKDSPQSCSNVTNNNVIMQTLVPILDGVILVIGLAGHSLVIAILAGRRRRGGQAAHGTDTLLLALTASDLLLLICLPFHTAAIALGTWPFGNFLCKAVSFLGVACSAASVFTMAALAVTRYMTVVHPTWAYRCQMYRHLKVMVVLIWVPASALAMPQFAVRMVSASSALHCYAFLSDLSQLVYSIALFLFAFAIPLGVIVAMYTKIFCFLRRTRLLGHAPQLERYQRQVTKTSALLVLVFTVLWLPSYSLMFSFIGGTTPAPGGGYRLYPIFARLLASSAAVVNPVLYVFMSQKFRRDLSDLGSGRCTWCRRHVICYPGRDMVRPFRPVEPDTPSDRGQP